MMITSPHNDKIQLVRSLLAQRKDREKHQAFVVEGVRLVEELLRTNQQASLVLFTARLSERGQAVAKEFATRGVSVEETTPELLDSIAGTETPQGILAVARITPAPLPADLNFVIALDTVRDPGNAGTILRTAEAAGVQAVFFPPGSVDPFSPKVVRAGMGAHFRVPILQKPWPQLHAECRERSPHMRFHLAEVGGGQPIWQVDMRQPFALIVGGEAEGASHDARAFVDQAITIPMPGPSESLNAAMAAGIILFEVVRQRQS